jgi:ferredoxin, 2Fe-2S
MSEDIELSIVVITPDGVRHQVPALAGWRVMELIRDAGLPIKAECGGAMACGTCHVFVEPEWLAKVPPMRDDERDALLDHALGVDAGSRLSCQLIMTDALNGLVVTLAP